jgi:hypothetical protein
MGCIGASCVKRCQELFGSCNVANSLANNAWARATVGMAGVLKWCLRIWFVLPYLEFALMPCYCQGHAISLPFSQCGLVVCKSSDATHSMMLAILCDCLFAS